MHIQRNWFNCLFVLAGISRYAVNAVPCLPQYRYIDIDQFTEVLTMGMEELVDAYFIELERDILIIQDFATTEHWVELERVSHYQNGASGVIGALIITELLRQITDRFCGRRNEDTNHIFITRNVKLLQDAIAPTKCEFAKAEQEFQRHNQSRRMRAHEYGR